MDFSKELIKDYQKKKLEVEKMDGFIKEKTSEIARGFFSFGKKEGHSNSVYAEYIFNVNYENLQIQVCDHDCCFLCFNVDLKKYDIFSNDFNFYECGSEIAKIERELSEERKLLGKRKLFETLKAELGE